MVSRMQQRYVNAGCNPSFTQRRMAHCIGIGRRRTNNFVAEKPNSSATTVSLFIHDHDLTIRTIEDNLTGLINRSSHLVNMVLLRTSNSAVCNGEQWHEPMDVDSTGTMTSSMLHIPRPPQELPSRCSSDPVHPNRGNVDAQVEELVEDWSRRMSCCSVDAQDWQHLYKSLQPRVTFSESSSMHVYHADPLYVRSKSYSKEERKHFSVEALSEAVRIKKLVLSTPGSSTKDSFKFLLKNNVIALEEIVGIEHLVLGKSASKLLKERQDHSKAVVQEQHRMGLMQECQSGKLCDKLGEFSASRSCKSVKRARIRAAMAA